MMNETEQAIKELIVEALNLEDIAPEDIESGAQLFGEGLGLDSIDALELGVAIRQKYGVNLDVDSEEIRQHFATVANLARFVSANGE